MLRCNLEVQVPAEPPATFGIKRIFRTKGDELNSNRLISHLTRRPFFLGRLPREAQFEISAAVLSPPSSLVFCGITHRVHKSSDWTAKYFNQIYVPVFQDPPDEPRNPRTL